MVMLARFRMDVRPWFSFLRKVEESCFLLAWFASRPRSMDTTRAARMPWPMTSQMKMPNLSLPRGMISKKSPARPEMGRYLEAKERETPLEEDARGYSLVVRACWISRASLSSSS